MPRQNRPRLALTPEDAKKLECIWNEHAASILAMLKSFCACPEDARDALQELFVRVGKNPSIVESMKSPRAFLIVSARRIAIDAARKRSSDQRREESPEAAEAVHPVPTLVKNDAELANAISRAVAELPADQRIVFEAKILQGKTLAVIAAEQSISLNTAASRLRYSLDKIRTRLRPHYETMKNQTTKSNTPLDSATRLIKPLEPKRVPSVVPGLEGVAALAVADGHIDNLDVHEPVLCICPAPVEIHVPEPVDHAIHIDPVVPEPATYELGSDGSDPAGHEVAPASEDSHADIPSASSEAELESHSGDASHDSSELLSAIFETNFTNETATADYVTESGIDFIDHTDSHDPGQQVDHPNFGEFFTLQIQPEHAGTESAESSDATGIFEFNEHDFNESLLTEYKSFLSDHPDWVEAHSGGEIQPQVITSSEYTGIDWENPGAAHSFDQWFHETYIAPYEGSSPAEGGTLVLAPDMHDHGTVVLNGDVSGSAWMGSESLLLSGSGLINGGLVHGDGILHLNSNNAGEDGHLVMPDHPTGIPEAWMRSGSLDLSGGGLNTNHPVAMPDEMHPVAFNSGAPEPMNSDGVVHAENLTIHDFTAPASNNVTIPVAQELVVANTAVVHSENLDAHSHDVPVSSTGVVEPHFHTEATALVSQPHEATAIAPQPDSHVVIAKHDIHSADAQHPDATQFSVTPIVSGSNSPIVSQEAHEVSHEHISASAQISHVPAHLQSELPVVIHSHEIQHLDAESDHETGITFVDDDNSHVEPAAEHFDADPSSESASASHDVAAAVGGAFVAGSATQITPASKGLSLRKNLIA